MIFNLISKIPMTNLTTPEGLVNHNRLVLVLGLLVYGGIAFMAYQGKLPTNLVAQLPTTDLKYLLGFMLLDACIYFGVHQFQYGIPPPLTMAQLERSMGPAPSASSAPSAPHSDQNKLNSNPDRVLTGIPPTIDEEDDDNTNLEVPDDISASLKEPGRHYQSNPQSSHSSHSFFRTNGKQVFSPPTPPDMSLVPTSSRSSRPKSLAQPQTQQLQQFQDDEPKEASLSGQDFFPEEESKAVIENWDTDEFTHEEYIPDDL